MLNKFKIKLIIKKLLYIQKKIGCNFLNICVKNYIKTIISILLIIFITLISYFFYFKFYISPLQKEALEKLFYAKEYFKKYEFKKALYGEKINKFNYLGFKDICKKYYYTKAGNIALYYSGLCYYKLKNYEKSIEYLNNFSSKDKFILYIKYGIMGDAYQQINDINNALKYYIKATENKKNFFVTPLYYYKAAILCLYTKKYLLAKEYLEIIKDNYPNFPFSMNVEKYLGLINQIIDSYKLSK